MKSQDITLPDEIGGLVMATHTFEAMFSHSAAAPQRKQKVGNKDIDQVSVVTPVMATLPERRREARMDYRHMCSYAVFEPIEESRSLSSKERPSHSTGVGRGSSSLWAKPPREAVDRTADPTIRMGPDCDCL